MSQETHFPKEKNYILPFSLAAPSRIFPNHHFFLNQSICWENYFSGRTKSCPEDGNKWKHKRSNLVSDNRPDDKLCKLWLLDMRIYTVFSFVLWCSGWALGPGLEMKEGKCLLRNPSLHYTQAESATVSPLPTWSVASLFRYHLVPTWPGGTLSRDHEPAGPYTTHHHNDSKTVNSGI